jgi:hypothetical protein
LYRSPSIDGLASERSGGGADKGGGSCEASAGTDYGSMIGFIPAMVTHRARPLPRSCTNVCAALMRGKEGRECLQSVCLIVCDQSLHVRTYSMPASVA